MKLSDLTIDADRLENGDWVDNIPEMGGVRLKVRGFNNSDWRKLQNTLIEATPRKQRLGGRLDPNTMDEITSKCLLNACLLDWDGLLDDNDKPIPYDKKRAEQLLKDPQYRKFREAVVWASQIVAEQINDEQEEISGN